ncbi:AI-2E family transporter [Saccharothrix sp. Mg75]|uniref:AI-2E family transporter n=1 Tax=Saccharothrix sp. Mg75 TaxID=3445357 RepID=UPI003EEFC7FD
MAGSGATTGERAGTGPLPRGLVVLLGCASAVVVVAGLRAAAWLVTPALLALVVVIAVSPLRRALRRRGVPRWAETTAVVATVYGVVVLFAVTVVASGAKLGALLPGYVDRGRELLARGSDLLDRAAGEPGQLRSLVESVDTTRVLSSLAALLGDLAGLATNLVFLLALLLFLSVDGMDARLAELSADRPGLGASLRSSAHRTRRYLVVTTVFGLVIAVVDTAALWALGVPLAVLWGLLSFVTNYIPNIGFLLGLAPPAVLALLEHGPRRALLVCAVYALVNFVGQSLVQPRFAGGAVGLSTTAAFVALVFWGWVLGPLGMLLAVPATLLVGAVLVDVDPRAAWVAALVRARSSAPGEETAP